MGVKGEKMHIGKYDYFADNKTFLRVVNSMQKYTTKSKLKMVTVYDIIIFSDSWNHEFSIIKQLYWKY